MASERKGRSSKAVRLTGADGAVAKGPGYLEGVMISNLSSSAGGDFNFTIYDATGTASGDILFVEFQAPHGSHDAFGARFEKGCYVAFSESATAADITVYISRT